MDDHPTESRRSPLLANRDFRLLLGGSAVSALGDQFTLVALPWLVLRLTGSPAALGLVLAAMALPRAIFMLLGGAMVDRLSARRILLLARSVNALLVALLAALVLTGAVGMSTIYAIALGIGVATAFAYPAGSALLPQLVAPAQLASANALLMGMRQLSLFVGPALAGVVIGVHAGHGAAEARGLGLAFVIDAASFLASLASLWLIRTAIERAPKPAGKGVLADIAVGVRHVWGDLPLRAFMLYAAVVTVFVGGPIQVGLPVLANSRMDLGAASLGILMTANGGGMLVGGFLARTVARAVGGRLGMLVLGMDTLAGLALAALARVHDTVHGAVLLAGVGVLAGVAQIAIVSWIQQRVPPALMGRTMSLLMFTFMGIGPVSAALAGSLLKLVSLGALFAGAGLALSVIALGCMTSPALRGIGSARPEGAPA
ncbi:MFS transporter [Frateuria sp. MAH-13]|uniref:MFS transporter n=1 Tax=Frateuria flava TaxID=2821489 RepID=A0ABS4DPC3_9GAMM|nr:MFS transporter [Frateuria flava]MBP1474871.1 MFS transporter [Frateuria flava]